MKNLFAFRHYALIVVAVLTLVGWQTPLYAEAQGDAAAQVSSSININTASASEIAEALNGVGEAKAEAIVAYRKKNGAFSSLEDLLSVSGIGEKTLEKNASSITF